MSSASRVELGPTPPGGQSRPLSRGLLGLRQPQALNFALLIVLVLGAWFRFHDLNWDENRHLHPDERFLSTVTNDIKWPENLDHYFDPTTSTLSPYTLPNVGLFVYGTLPVYIVKGIALLLHKADYDNLTLIGRALSGVFDLATVLMLFLIGRRLYGKSTAVLAAALLALSVFNIQLSHFYAVDTYANLFIVAAMYFLLIASESGRGIDYALTGLMLGLGLASKVTVLTLAAPILVGVGLEYYRVSRRGDPRSALQQSLMHLVIVFLFAAVAFHLAQPIAFAGPGFLNWSLNPRWLRDLAEQQNTVSGAADLPWVQQWTNRSFFFPLDNIMVWGLGLPLGLASLGGLGLAIYELVRRQKLAHLLPLVYVTVTFTYHAATFVKFMRYFLPIYPFLVLFAAYLIVEIWQKAYAPRDNQPAAVPEDASASPRRRRLKALLSSRPLAVIIATLVLGGTLLYAAAFSTIYSRTNSRVAASRWIYQNIPPGSTLANEHWDDWMPIGGVDGKNSYGDQGLYKAVEMANYDDDAPAKLDKMVDNLSHADYLILSSNRLYGSIPRLPLRYPMTIHYYQMLFDGQLGFERIADFTSYPGLFGIQIPDQAAEESFTVYDHPEVQIFRKTAAFDPGRVRQELAQGVSWDSVLHLTPLQVTQAPTGLMLSTADEDQYQRAAVWSSAEVSANSWGGRVPALAWILMLFAIGMLTVPITWLAFRNLSDRGYIFSKSIGLLIVAWGAWLVASLRLAPFTLYVILAMLGVLALASAAIAWRHWTQLRRFIRARWPLLLFEEAVFWIFLALMLAIRLGNPDLWNPFTGGEKPMDLAYLTAIVRTPYFPAYDPWFTGGYINYYYFGFVLVAALIHLTGVVPTIAYNLAVPTFFAMTALGGFSVALNLAHLRRRARRGKGRLPLRVDTSVLLAGLCGALFVAIIGNLAQVKLIWDGILNLSTLSPDAGGSLLAVAARFLDGLNQWIAGHPLPIHLDWWYWNATRVIPKIGDEAGPINEMPFFTYVFADLHAHAMALPFTLLALALSLNMVLSTSGTGRSSGSRPWWRDTSEVLTLALLALTTGALWPMNTWDFPTYTLLAGAALTFRELARRRLGVAAIWAVVWRLVLVGGGGWLLFLPFHQNYATAYIGIEIWKGSRTPLWAYILIHGFFLFVLASYLLLELLVGRGHNPWVRSLRLHLIHWRHPRRLQHLFDLLARPSGGYRLGVTIGQGAFVVVILVLLLDPVVGLALGLTLLAGMLLWSARPDPRRQFLLFMIGLGFLLTGVVEVVVLKGDISRMNTVFKFYLQVWILWAVASAAILPTLARRLNSQRASESSKQLSDVPRTALEVRSTGNAAKYPRDGVWSQRWWWAFGLLLGACMLYPLTAAPARVRDRFENSRSVTLDGAAYMRTSVYSDEGRPITLEWDRQAIDWLHQNVPGIPTILEANTPLYRWGSRVSIYTGLPTVIGWDWHQKQQRSAMPGQIVDRRLDDVRTIYNTADPAEALRLLNQYHVVYIYVGTLEKIYYDAAGLSKFDQPSDLWGLVYQNEQVRIYQVR